MSEANTPNIKDLIAWLRSQGAEEITIGEEIRVRFGPKPNINGMPDQLPNTEDRAKALRDLYYASS